MNIQETIEAVRQWGLDRNITGPNGKGTLLGQLSKSQEELTETRDAALLHESCLDEMRNSRGEIVPTIHMLADGIGDCTVTLIIAAEMAGLCFEDCLQAAYDEIKGRTGSMVNGVFVKSNPSQP